MANLSAQVTENAMTNRFPSNEPARAGRERHHKWINRQLTNVAATGNIARLVEVVNANLDSMNLINVSTVLHRLAKLAFDCEPPMRPNFFEHASMQQCQQAVIRHLGLLEFSTGSAPHLNVKEHGASAGPGVPMTERLSEMRCLSIICWSCATLRIHEELFFNRVAQVSKSRFMELKPFELSNMMWAFAKLSLGQKAFFEGIASCLMQRREGEFSPSCLSTIVWAFGTAKVHHSAVCSSLAGELVKKAHTLVSQSISNTAWGFARLRRQEAPLFRELAEASTRDSLIWTFKTQELSNMAWAFATVGLPHQRLFTCLAEVVNSRRFELAPQNMANIFWAFAKLKAPNRKQLFPPLLQVAICRMGIYKPQEVSAMLWGASKEVGCPVCRHFFLAVPHTFKSRLAEFTSQAMACMVEAFAQARVEAPEFFQAMVDESLRRLRSFGLPSLCTLFRGIALKDIHQEQGPGLREQLRVIGDHVAELAKEMQPHNFVHLSETLDLLQPALHPRSLASLLNAHACSVRKLSEMSFAAAESLSVDDQLALAKADCMHGIARQGSRRTCKRRGGKAQATARPVKSPLPLLAASSDMEAGLPCILLDQEYGGLKDDAVAIETLGSSSAQGENSQENALQDREIQSHDARVQVSQAKAPAVNPDAIVQVSQVVDPTRDSHALAQASQVVAPAIDGVSQVLGPVFASFKGQPELENALVDAMPNFYMD